MPIKTTKKSVKTDRYRNGSPGGDTSKGDDTGSKTKPKSKEAGRHRSLAGGREKKDKEDKITVEKLPKATGELEPHATEKTTRKVEKKSMGPDDPEHHANREHRVACPNCDNTWSYDTYYNMWYNAYYQEWYSEYYQQYYNTIEDYYQNPWGSDSGSNDWGKGGYSSSTKKSKKSKKKSKSSSSGKGKGKGGSSGKGSPPRPEVRCNEEYYPPSNHGSSNRGSGPVPGNMDALKRGSRFGSTVKVPAIAGAVAGFVVLVLALIFFFAARVRRKIERDSRRSIKHPPSSRSGRGESAKGRKHDKSDFSRRDKRNSSHRSDRSDSTDQTEESAEDVTGALPSYLSGVRVGPDGRSSGRDVELAMARGAGVTEKQVSWRDRQQEEGAWPSLINDLTFDSLSSWISPRNSGA